MMNKVKIVINKVNRDFYNFSKEKITKLTIEGNTLEECFKTIYEYERSARYNNYLYYDFDDKDIKNAYYEWKKTGVTISMYYGGGVVD